jgi:hypothetical protein
MAKLGAPGTGRLGARPSNSQQAEVLEFYCRMAHQADAIQQFCPVECIILSSPELLGRAPRARIATRLAGPRIGAFWKPGDPALISFPGPAWLGAR